MAGNPRTKEGVGNVSNINDAIIEALRPTGIYTTANRKQAKTNVYFVFNYDSTGDNFGDDAPNNERYLIQIHLFCPPDKDTVELIGKVKKLLFENDFTFPEMINDSDEEAQHLIFECEKVVEVYG